MIYQVLYISFATVPITPLVVKSIESKASVNNPRDGITGILLMNSNMYMQLLEGEKENVKKKFETIKSDQRHEEVTLIYEGETEARFFEDWSMLCKEINHCDLAFITKIVPYFNKDKILESPMDLVEILHNFSVSFEDKKAS
jgi:hypothetical protein